MQILNPEFYHVASWVKGICIICDHSVVYLSGILTAGGMVQEHIININILCDTHLELPLY